MSSVKFVQLDLNNPVFQESWFELVADEAERARATLKKITKLTWQQVYTDKGLHWEKIYSITPPRSLDAIYSFCLSKSSRGLGFQDGQFLRVLLVSADHDGSDGRK
jgi:hypothetical protein